MKTLKLVAIILFIINGFVSFAQNSDYRAVNGVFSYQMLGDEVNNQNKEWSYTPKQTTVIGVPFTPVPVQVTYDGSIFTKDSELFFFYGKEKTPLLAMQKTFYQGWIPIVQYDWVDEGLDYHIEIFGHTLTAERVDNSIQYVRVQVKNNTSERKSSYFGAGIRSTGGAIRFGTSAFSSNSVYGFQNNEFLRDGRTVYSFSGKPNQYSIKDEKYKQMFSNKDYAINKETAVGLVDYDFELNPGQTYTIELKYPRVAIDTKDKSFLELFRDSKYDAYRAMCEQYWRDKIEENGHFSIPESRVNDSYKAALVHLMLATRTSSDGVRRQGSGLPYDALFFIDFIDMRLAYDIVGLSDFVELNFDWLRNSINEEGLFVDSSVSHNREIMTSHGQALYSICNHFRYVDDKKLAKSMLATVRKAVGLIEKDHKTQPTGLVRPSLPFDAEMIEGHYTGQNLFCLLGLRSAISYAEYLGLNKEANNWRKLELSYRKSIALAIEQSAHADGYIPTGLYDYKTGLDCGWASFRTDQDWENPLLIYPSEMLALNDPKVVGTLNHIRKTKFREGIMTYRNGMHLHQYVTTNLTNQHIAINDQKTALYDLYHILLHNGSTHEGFENLINPWGERDPKSCPAPHAWAAAKTALLIRNCLIREHGGEAGINMKERSLYLYSVLSPRWLKTGEKIEIINAKTEFGTTYSTMNILENGAEISLQSDYRVQPKDVRIAIPYYKTLKDVSVEGHGSVHISNGYIICDANVQKINITWTDKVRPNYLHEVLQNYRKEPGFYWQGVENDILSKYPDDIMNSGGQLIVIPGQPDGFLTDEEKTLDNEELSFDLVKKAYLLEYDRRRVQYLRAGKKLQKICAPSIK